MKKVSVLLLVLILLLVGCSNVENASEGLESKEGNNTESNSSKTPEKETSSEGYVFEANGVTIAMSAEAAPILESLGDSMDYFEAKSCAFEGLDKIYTYSGFELHTYEIDGVDHVAAVILVDDSVSTKEGVYLYSPLEDVLAAYGEKYKKELGLYTYELDKSKISFLIEEDEVTSIEYNAITE